MRYITHHSKSHQKITLHQCCPQEFLWKGEVEDLLIMLSNHWATEKKVLKILYKPMTRFYDFWKCGAPKEPRWWQPCLYIFVTKAAYHDIK